jgi:hypothetical protein
MQQAFDALDRLRAYQTLNRSWRPHLNVQERDFLCWLLDQTVAWGRDHVRATIDQMVTGTNWLPAVHIPERTLYRTIQALKELGVIESATTRRGTLLSINLDWHPVSKPRPALARPKRLTQRAETPRPWAVDEHLFEDPSYAEANHARSSYISDPDRITGIDNPDDFLSDLPSVASVLPPRQDGTATVAASHCQPGSPQKEKQEKKSIKNSSAPRSDFGELDLGVTDAHAESTPTRLTAESAISAVSAKAGRSKPKKLTVWTTWRDAWVETFPGSPCPPWPIRDQAIVRKVTERVKLAGIEPLVFVDWSVRQWRQIMVSEFAWMDKRSPPALPEPMFLAKFVGQFLNRWSVDEETTRLSRDMSREGEIEKLIRSGMSYEDALIAIGKRKGVAEKRAEFDAQAREAARLMRVAQQTPQTPLPSRSRRRMPVLQVNHGTNPHDTGDLAMPDFSSMNFED